LLLQKAGVEFGFDVTSTQTFCEGGVRISSTAVRQALADDDLPSRRRCWGIRLPSPVASCTAMSSAHNRLPTANLPLRRQVSPVKGSMR
jgi:riboflavin kinase/FMN adenylyltransferase